jgi:hypothetical protein
MKEMNVKSKAQDGRRVEKASKEDWSLLYMGSRK